MLTMQDGVERADVGTLVILVLERQEHGIKMELGVRRVGLH